MEDNFLEIAKQAAVEAGQIVKKYSSTKLTLQGKGHHADFATKADLESEQKIIELLVKNFPDHNIIAEESGQITRGSEYTWAIDPIDGTIPFVDGIPTFGVSIGLFKNDKPYLGVINMVATNELYWAELGKGAFLNGKKLRVSEESNLENCAISIDLGHSERIMKLDNFFMPIIEKVRYVYLLGSAVSILSYIARGMIDAYIIRANIWDLAAGIILITEAGGRVTDISGGPVDFSKGKPRLVCSNGLVHDVILKIYN